MLNTLESLFNLARDRKKTPVDGSYTNKLLSDKSLSKEKVLEEINELIEAVDKDSNKIHEAADVFYHLIMYLEANDVKIEDVMEELNKRKNNMFSLLRAQIIIGLIILTILTWATQNVCRYNFVLDKKKNITNIISEELKPSLALTEVYYYKELNCNDADFDLDIDRVMNNIRTISVMVHQYFTTDITGKSLND